MLSRFRSRKEQKPRDAEKGGIDVHHRHSPRCCQDVVFKDLGLLIVDEEQRFGVGQKERLKQIRRTLTC